MIGMFDYTSTRLSAMESVSVIQMLVVAVGCNGQLQLTQRNPTKSRQTAFDSNTEQIIQNNAYVM